MWKNRVMYLLLLVGMVIFYIDHSKWVSWFALLITLLMPVFSLLLSLPALLGKRIQLSVQEQCYRNEEISVSISLKTGFISYAPLCKLTIRTDDLMTGTHKIKKIIFSESSPFKIPIFTEHSGIYKCEITKARAYDLLGLFSFPIKLPEPVRVAVMPTAKRPEPCPDLNRFRTSSYRPKPGGGFSEIHEMREYRPGDPLRTMHWKLSAKTDTLIIREAQEPEQNRIQVTLALSENREQMDAVLDELYWVSRELMELEISHSVWVVNSNAPELQSVIIDTEGDLQTLLYNIMSHPVNTILTQTPLHNPQQAAQRYHIDPHRKGDNYEKA